MARTIYGLKDEFVRDAESMFRTKQALYNTLGTSNRYWDPVIKARLGVKENTLRDIALQLYRTLKEIAANRDVRGVHRDVALRLYEKYFEEIEALDTSEVIEIVIEEPEKAQTPVALREVGA